MCSVINVLTGLYFDFSFGNFDNSTYEQNITELFTSKLIE